MSTTPNDADRLAKTLGQGGAATIVLACILLILMVITLLAVLATSDK
jgi:hypothetical protein